MKKKQPHRRSVLLYSALLVCLLFFLSRWYLSGYPAHLLAVPHSTLYGVPSRQQQQQQQQQQGSVQAASLSSPSLHRPVYALYLPHTAGGQSDFAALRAWPSGSGPFPAIRPFEGFYDSAQYQTRHRQGRLARAYGVDGFVFYHYWQAGRAQASAGLEAMLIDSEPSLPFALAWDNSLSGSEPGGAAQWRAHFDWLLPFFQHSSYIAREGGRPLLLLARSQGEAAAAMLQAWREWAVAAGLPGLYIVQMNGQEWAPGVLRKAPAVDGVVEVYPGLGQQQRGLAAAPTLRELQATSAAAVGAAPGHYFRGVHAGYSDAPRAAAQGSSSGSSSTLVYHPTNLRAALRAQLALTPPGSFLLLNAWNDWGVGCAIEPSVEQGFAWLEAVRAAVQAPPPPLPLGSAALAAGGDYLPPLPLAGLGGRDAQQPQQHVCILVRTYTSHDDASESLFNLGRLLRSLVALEHTAWRAHVVDTGESVFAGMAGIVQAASDPRISVFDTPAHLRQPYSGRTSSYDLTDYALTHACLEPPPLQAAAPAPAPAAAWFVVTNGDNFYTPDAFNYLPPRADMVLMNFYSRYSLANAITFTGAGLQSCCSRLANYRCTPASPQIAFVDVGAMVVRAASWSAASLTFARFHGACGQASCHDGAFAQHALDTLHWRLAYHPVTVCALHHNPNPVSCALVGGLYYDAADWAQAKCFEPAEFSALGLGMGQVDWQKFMGGQGCVCAA